MSIFRPQRKRTPTSRPGSAPTAISRRCLDSALACGRSSYPNEFGGILRADEPGTITELLLLPGTTSGRRHANFQLHMMPVDLAVAGTVHSHPSGALHPSEADVSLFRRWGRRHIILGSPFTQGAWRAYDSNGREVHLDVVGEPEVDDEPGEVRVYRPRAIHRDGRPSPEPPPLDDEP